MSYECWQDQMDDNIIIQGVKNRCTLQVQVYSELGSLCSQTQMAGKSITGLFALYFSKFRLKFQISLNSKMIGASFEAPMPEFLTTVQDSSAARSVLKAAGKPSADWLLKQFHKFLRSPGGRFRERQFE